MPGAPFHDTLGDIPDRPVPAFNLALGLGLQPLAEIHQGIIRAAGRFGAKARGRAETPGKYVDLASAILALCQQASTIISHLVWMQTAAGRTGRLKMGGR